MMRIWQFPPTRKKVKTHKIDGFAGKGCTISAAVRNYIIWSAHVVKIGIARASDASLVLHDAVVINNGRLHFVVEYKINNKSRNFIEMCTGNVLWCRKTDVIPVKRVIKFGFCSWLRCVTIAFSPLFFDTIFQKEFNQWQFITSIKITQIHWTACAKSIKL